MKQQIDLPCSLSSNVINSLSDTGKRLIGMNVRVPSNKMNFIYLKMKDYINRTKDNYYDSSKPITKNITIHISSYKTSISSDSIGYDCVDNYFCEDTGLTFNSSGTRKTVKKFYTDEYNLHRK